MPNVKYTFFDFLFRGYKDFKKDFDELLSKHDKYGLEKEVHYELKESIPKYISDIFSASEDEDFEGFIGFILLGFVHQFLSETDARFTLRQINEEQTKMETIFTTREDSIPGSIPINKKNLIKRSMNLGVPLLYSRNKDHHYNTRNKSLKRGIYDEYVSYCLLKTGDNKPYFSICLDVKGEIAVNRVRTLVDSNYFTLICNLIAERIYKELNT